MVQRAAQTRMAKKMKPGTVVLNAACQGDDCGDTIPVAAVRPNGMILCRECYQPEIPGCTGLQKSMSRHQPLAWEETVSKLQENPNG